MREVRPLNNWVIKLARRISQAAKQNVTDDQITKDTQDLLQLEADLCAVSCKQSTCKKWEKFPDIPFAVHIFLTT